MISPRSSRWPSWSALLLVLIVITAFRLRLASMPLERDEGEYAYAGQLLLHGIPPYQSAYNMKFPGTYVMYAVILDTAGRIWGQTPTALRVGLAIVNATNILLVFALSRRFWSRAASVAAAASFGLLSLDLGTEALMGHATHFVLVPALAGLLMVVRSNEDAALLPDLSAIVCRCAAAGGFFGVAVLMKQPGLFFAPLGYFWWASQMTSKRGWRPVRQKLVIGTIAFALGFAVPLLICALWLWHAGVFARFWFWTIDYARAYAVELSWGGAIEALRSTVESLTRGGGRVIWGIAVIGFALATAAGRRSKVRRRGIVFIALLGAASLVATSVGFYFRPHYFILLMPAAALSVAAFFDTPIGRSARWRLLVLLLGCGAFFYLNGNVLLRQSPLEVMRLMYGTNPFIEAVSVGNYLRLNTEQQDRVAVLGSEPELLFYSDRMSATGYIYTYGLMENQPYAHQMQKEMAAQIEAAKPLYVIRVKRDSSWLRRSDSDVWIFDWSRRFLNGYERVEMPVPGGLESSLWIYRRKQRF